MNTPILGTHQEEFVSDLSVEAIGEADASEEVVPDPSETEVDSAELNTDTVVDEAGEAPEGEDFDLSEYADRMVTITVDGEQVRVPLSEVANGYSRQSNYTRQTQELAAQREQLSRADALAKALEINPAATLATLQQLYGTPAETDDEELTDEQRDLRDLKAWRAQAEATQQRDATIAEASAALAEHGLSAEGVSENDLFTFAMKHQIGSLPFAAKALKAERGAAKKAADTKVVAAKRAAAVVEGASTRTPGAVVPKQTETIEESYYLAKQQLGLA